MPAPRLRRRGGWRRPRCRGWRAPAPTGKRADSRLGLCFHFQIKEVEMSYEESDDYGMYKNRHGKGPGPELMGANTLLGDHVHNLQNEHLGVIKEFMVDMRSGAIAYAVMSANRFVGI